MLDVRLQISEEVRRQNGRRDCAVAVENREISVRRPNRIASLAKKKRRTYTSAKCVPKRVEFSIVGRSPGPSVK